MGETKKKVIWKSLRVWCNLEKIIIATEMVSKSFTELGVTGKRLGH